MQAMKKILDGMGQIDLYNILKKARKENDHEVFCTTMYHICRDDLELFAYYFFPHYCEFAFNEFHDHLFKIYKTGERGTRRSHGAPRGYAKSTFAALIKLIHDIAYGLESFVVILSETEQLAIGKMRDIRTEVLTNPKLYDVYGMYFPRKNIGESQFIVFTPTTQVMFMAFGSGAELRGMRYGANRPSKIVCDDVENSEEVHSEVIRTKKENWFFEVVSKIGNEKTNIDFVGTILHKKSLLSKLCKNPAYDAKIFKSVISWSDRQDLWDKWQEIYTDLDNNDRRSEADKYYKDNKAQMLKGVRVLWPEKEPYEFLMKELIEIGRRAFMKEKQNQPMGSDERIFDNLHWYRENERGLLLDGGTTEIPWNHVKYNCYGVIDPATGQTKAKRGSLGDFTCILVGYQDSRGRLFVHADWTKRAAPSKFIDQMFEMHNLFEFQKFAVETNLYRNLLMPNLVDERKRREREHKKIIKLPFYDVENTENKYKRIYTLEPKVHHGWIIFNRSLSNEFISQLEDFPNPDCHDDGPDALEMLWGLVNNRFSMSNVSVNAMGAR